MSLHKHYSYNCLTDEQFAELMAMYPQESLDDGVEFSCDCDECGTFYLPNAPGFGDHRCSCGNRRCYVQFCETSQTFYIEVD